MAVQEEISGAVEIFSEDVLGVGSYGKVCKAKYCYLPCAAKLLHDTMFQTNDPGINRFVERFEQECQFLKTIMHPNIVQYLGTSRDPQTGRLALLLELMDESLTKFLEQHTCPVPYHTQLNICHDVALALVYLHSNGIIHRDLSSNNVLLAGGIRAKVTDFGMCKLVDMNHRMTPLTMCPGTAAYMPPEALITPPLYSNKLDCFSHGVLVIQVITKQFPNPGAAHKYKVNPTNPTGREIVEIPETERRKKDIDLVEPDHPLLPLALDSLNDRDTLRPSANELCERLAMLKSNPRYTRSMEQSVETTGEMSQSKGASYKQNQDAATIQFETNVDELPTVPPSPLPPRGCRANPGTLTGPPLPPKQQQNPPRETTRKPESDRQAYFSKIFNGCHLHLNCAASWIHPETKAQYILLGAEEGLFSLYVTPNFPDQVMEQVSSRVCHWLCVVENALIWISGNGRFIATTNLTILFQTETQKPHRRIHTVKVPDTRSCSKCCTVRNPFTDQRFLIAAVPKGILLMQWNRPENVFKFITVYECLVPSPLNLLEAFVYEGEEYPIVCFGVKKSADEKLNFDTLNLNTPGSWLTKKLEGHHINVLCLQQLREDTFFIGFDCFARFVDKNGIKKPNITQASELAFERKTEHMICMDDVVVSFHKHGIEGRSLRTQQVTANLFDESKIFHVIGSCGTMIIEARDLNDQNSTSNIYILVT